MKHPLSGDLTRAAEAAGALRALLMAEGDERVQFTDRMALRHLLDVLAAEVGVRETLWVNPGVRANVGRLARLLARDDGR